MQRIPEATEWESTRTIERWRSNPSAHAQEKIAQEVFHRHHFDYIPREQMRQLTYLLPIGERMPYDTRIAGIDEAYATQRTLDRLLANLWATYGLLEDLRLRLFVLQESSECIDAQVDSLDELPRVLRSQVEMMSQRARGLWNHGLFERLARARFPSPVLYRELKSNAIVAGGCYTPDECLQHGIYVLTCVTELAIRTPLELDRKMEAHGSSPQRRRFLLALREELWEEAGHQLVASASYELKPMPGFFPDRPP